jgi:hypothetical protein
MLGDTREASDTGLGALAFRDEADRTWEVREIRQPLLPSRGKLLLCGEYAGGWLLFISGDERRRLAPYPPGWRLADASRLRCWVNDARPVRTTAFPGTGERECELPPSSGSPRDPV